jgi:hypothetical protein
VDVNERGPRFRRVVTLTAKEDAMAIQWREDVDAALAEGRASGRPVLLDFNAAPL